MTYYHGGVPGLSLGEQLLPPSRTGRTDSAARIVAEHGLGADYVREDVVFLGATLDIANLYAAMYPAASGGWVYEVEPAEPVEPDPDYSGDDPMESVQCPSATIVRVLGPLPPAFVGRVRDALMGASA